jgi:hypothetical protein
MQSPLYNAEDKNEWSCTSTDPICLHGVDKENVAQKCVNSHTHTSAFHWPVRTDIRHLTFNSSSQNSFHWRCDPNQHTHVLQWRPRDQFAVALSLEDPGSVSHDAILTLTFLLSFVPTPLLLPHRVRLLVLYEARIYWLVERQLASQEGLCYMELVIFIICV